MEIKKHRLIKISLVEKLLIFVHVYLPCLARVCKWGKRREFMRLYNEGKRKIDRDFNVIRMVKNLNFLKIFMMNNLMSDKVRWQVAHCEKNIIMLDTGSSGSQEDDADTNEEEA